MYMCMCVYIYIYIYIYIFFFRFFSHIGYYKILSMGELSLLMSPPTHWERVTWRPLEHRAQSYSLPLSKDA